MKCIHDELGLYGQGTIYDMEKRILRYHFARKVVLIDEAQNLDLRSLRQLLHLSAEDEGQLSFVFCGNSEVLKQVNTDSGAFAQISRRITFREIIDAIQEEDADDLSRSFGVEGIEAFKLMREIGRNHRADGIVRLLTVARDTAESRPITVEHIRAVAGSLWQFAPIIRAQSSTTKRKSKPS